MLLTVFAFAAGLQEPQQPSAPAPQIKPSPVARLVVKPGPRPSVTAGDTVRLAAEALDSAGRPVPDVRVRFVPAGGYFEGSVGSDGLVTSGSTGTLPVSVVASVPGARPFVERIEVHMLPGPAARVDVSPQVTRLAAGQRIRFTGQSYSAARDPRSDTIAWESSAPRVVRIGEDGLATALAPGRAVLTARAGQASSTLAVEVVSANIQRVEVSPARSTGRTGDVIRFSARAIASNGRAIEGLTPTWSLAPGQGRIDPDGAFVGYEAGDYVVSASYGSASGDAPVTLTERDVRRPLTVVGRVPRDLFNTEEVWVHPNGKYAYLGTGGGGDRFYTIDISNPAAPVVTDSIVANTRRVNDVMTTPDGKTLVFTREGASDRKNGIVIAALDDPAHPKVIAEFTEGVTAGVHSAFIYQDARHGTHIFLTNDGTGALHVVNIDDPYKPREVAQWRTDRPDAGRTLHDVDVQDGLAYLSYWNDGLVILDVGNGMKGGRPDSPVLVSQFKYDLNALYRDVEATAGPGFIRGTHTAWRHKDYVFIADEVFPAGSVKGAKDAAAGRAYGRLQVVDISKLDQPRSVAFYEPEHGGVHNIWIAGDTLYLGAYNGGFRAFDVSGELRGDLRAQGREMAHLNTADMDGRVKNTAMTWGVVVKDGLAYVNDMYNGLWIVRIEPRREEALP